MARRTSDSNVLTVRNTDNDLMTTNADNLTAGILKLRNMLENLSAENDIEATVGVGQPGQVACHSSDAWMLHRWFRKIERDDGFEVVG